MMVLTFAAVLPNDSEAARTRRDYFMRPQVGLWFGPVTPLGTTAEKLNKDLGAGLMFRYNTPYRPLKFGLEVAYEKFKSDGNSELRLWPMYGNALYLLPIPLPVKFQYKLGAGTANVKIWPDEKSQWDPLLMTGLEMSFPAGRLVNIGLRLDYLMLYEKHIDGSDMNGHILNSGITVYFNLNL